MRGMLLLVTVAALGLALTFFPEAAFLLSRGQEIGHGFFLLVCCSFFIIAAWALFQPANHPRDLIKPMIVALAGPAIYTVMVITGL
ncbi:hypothetical protein G7076_05015 [Sphingomonas sp. HDW15A]|uniref:hypothetical protein n=1 Tax=Sphingomonas sp. HDW15A TaxID=2714942 RepID=UPI00140B0068|nr:hypothetical protein [Sphingomonas sp. HDW15A]QIK95913.1 hypothetical protein G7076_05015 [Sphingomonas sp. HDW15A]